MIHNPFDNKRFIDNKIEQISGAGTLVGKFLGSFGRHSFKVTVGVAVLVIVGIAAFIWAVAQGAAKKR